MLPHSCHQLMFCNALLAVCVRVNRQEKLSKIKDCLNKCPVYLHLLTMCDKPFIDGLYIFI